MKSTVFTGNEGRPSDGTHAFEVLRLSYGRATRVVHSHNSRSVAKHVASGSRQRLPDRARLRDRHQFFSLLLREWILQPDLILEHRLARQGSIEVNGRDRPLKWKTMVVRVDPEPHVQAGRQSGFEQLMRTKPAPRPPLSAALSETALCVPLENDVAYGASPLVAVIIDSSFSCSRPRAVLKWRIIPPRKPTRNADG